MSKKIVDEIVEILKPDIKDTYLIERPDDYPIFLVNRKKTTYNTSKEDKKIDELVKEINKDKKCISIIFFNDIDVVGFFDKKEKATLIVRAKEYTYQIGKLIEDINENINKETDNLDVIFLTNYSDVELMKSEQVNNDSMQIEI